MLQIIPTIRDYKDNRGGTVVVQHCILKCIPSLNDDPESKQDLARDWRAVEDLEQWGVLFPPFQLLSVAEYLHLKLLWNLEAN